MQTVPSKAVAMGKKMGSVTARTTTEFEVESRNAADRPSKQGGDQVTVKFSAPGSSTAAAVTELPEGRYKIEYTAPNPGTYQMTVKMNGEQIVGSPFKVVVTVPKAQADMCTVQGKALTQLTAGEVGAFTVNFIDKLGANAPPAELDIRVKPEGVPIPGPDDPIYVPPKVQSTFDSFDADGSGDIDFSELRQALSQLGMGDDRKAVAVLLRRYDSDGGGLSIEEFAMLVADMEMAASTGYLLHGTTATAEKSTRSVSYEVRVAGNYDVHIAFAAASGGGFFNGSPFRLKVLPAKASAEATELPPGLLTGLKTAVGESGEFVLQAIDQFKNACSKGGDKIRVSAVGGRHPGSDQTFRTCVPSHPLRCLPHHPRPAPRPPLAAPALPPTTHRPRAPALPPTTHRPRAPACAERARVRAPACQQLSPPRSPTWPTANTR